MEQIKRAKSRHHFGLKVQLRLSSQPWPLIMTRFVWAAYKISGKSPFHRIALRPTLSLMVGAHLFSSGRTFHDFRGPGFPFLLLCVASTLSEVKVVKKHGMYLKINVINNFLFIIYNCYILTKEQYQYKKNIKVIEYLMF